MLLEEKVAIGFVVQGKVVEQPLTVSDVHDFAGELHNPNISGPIPSEPAVIRLEASEGNGDTVMQHLHPSNLIKGSCHIQHTHGHSPKFAHCVFSL